MRIVFGFPSAVRDDDRSFDRQRLIILRNLVGLGEIGIKILFAGKDGMRRDLAADAKACPDQEFHGFLIQIRQNPGCPQQIGQIWELGVAPNWR